MKDDKVAIENLKYHQKFYHNQVCDYYKKYKTTSTLEFQKIWDKFISICEVIYIFEAYPFSYNVFLQYNKKQDYASYEEYEKVYEYCIDLLYQKMGIYFR